MLKMNSLKKTLRTFKNPTSLLTVFGLKTILPKTEPFNFSHVQKGNINLNIPNTPAILSYSRGW